MPAWIHPAPRQYLLSRNISEAECLQYALHYYEGPWKRWDRRLLIPMYDTAGTLLAFQARSLDPNAPKATKYLTSGPRPFYCPWPVPGATLAIVEGPFDCYSVNRIVPTGAILGNQISQRQINQIVDILRLGIVQKIVVWLDRDAAAEAARLTQTLSRYAQTEVLHDESAKDPGALGPDTVRTILQSHGVV